ncbi:uncharacterized protein LOC129966609 [Argiope bruennichi]|uniref:uncharacterized protein LOC129966609 n=1 Tax=Argiope bruennichi TaxID=94029 RepID=UPI0024957ACB|nr:uncharacterized protein LOC129966609 [Argiope bruennichi]
MCWLNIFIIGVIAGLVSCDIDCFDKESSPCRPRLPTDETSTLDDFCRSQLPFINCLNNAANKCKSFQEEIESWFDAVKDACTDGTKLNKELEAGAECMRGATREAECLVGSEEDLKDEPEDKQLCQQFESVTDCLYQKVERACGRNVADSFLAVYDPMIKYQLKICKEIILKRN